MGQPKVGYIDDPKAEEREEAEEGHAARDPGDGGGQYRVGEIKFEGLTVLKEEWARTLFKLATGDVYNDSKIKKGYDKLRDVYGGRATSSGRAPRKRRPDLEQKVVDVTLAMDEDKRYYVGRIKFTGNETTRDKVIRREVYLNEGDVFNTELLKLSIRRINQLGYFKPMEGAPDLRPSEKGGEDKLDVTFKVEEQNRNQFTFGGGVSGLEGAFLNASFQTANFLGLGETLTLARPDRQPQPQNYQFAITEPYFLDRPITAGVDVFLRRITYLSLPELRGLQPAGPGDGPHHRLPGRPLLARRSLSYSYQIIDLYRGGLGRPRRPGTQLRRHRATTFHVVRPRPFWATWAGATRAASRPSLGAQHRRQPLSCRAAAPATTATSSSWAARSAAP